MVNPWGVEKANTQEDIFKRQVDSSVWLRHEDIEVLLLSTNYIETVAGVIISYLRHCGKNNDAEKLKKLNDKFYKVYNNECKAGFNFYEILKISEKIDKSLDILYAGLSGTSKFEKILQIRTMFSNLSMEDLIPREAKKFQGEIKTSIEKHFQVVSVWVNEADPLSNSDFRKESLRSTIPPNDFKDGGEKARDAFSDFYRNIASQ